MVCIMLLISFFLQQINYLLNQTSTENCYELYMICEKLMFNFVGKAYVLYVIKRIVSYLNIM